MFSRHPVRSGYVAVLGALVMAALVVSLAAPGSEAAQVLVVFAVVAAVPLAFSAMRSLWRMLTYRVGVRLFISYLLIGLTPFALFGGLALIVGYVLVGQYAATRVGNEMERLEAALATRAGLAAGELAGGRAAHARELLQGAESGHEQGLREEWLLADGASEWRSPGATGLPVPRWTEGSWRGQVVHGGSAFLAGVERRGSAVAAVLVPMDIANADAFARGRWYEVRFVTQVKAAGGEPRAAETRRSSLARKRVRARRSASTVRRYPRRRSSGVGWARNPSREAAGRGRDCCGCGPGRRRRVRSTPVRNSRARCLSR